MYTGWVDSSLLDGLALCSLKGVVTDPGFPLGGGTNSRGGATYDFAKLSRKLHQIERIWVPKEARVPVPPPLDPPMYAVWSTFVINNH